MLSFVMGAVFSVYIYSPTAIWQFYDWGRGGMDDKGITHVFKRKTDCETARVIYQLDGFQGLSSCRIKVTPTEENQETDT